MYRVLLPIDSDEERALAAAEAVVSFAHVTEDVAVTILNVQKRIDVTGGEGGQIDSAEWYDPEAFPESVTEARDVLDSAGITVETRREHADPAETILEVAGEIDADQIVMSGRKRTPVGKALFGSVTQSVLLHSDVPVTVAFR